MSVDMALNSALKCVSCKYYVVDRTIIAFNLNNKGFKYVPIFLKALSTIILLQQILNR